MSLRHLTNTDSANTGLAEHSMLGNVPPVSDNEVSRTLLVYGETDPGLQIKLSQLFKLSPFSSQLNMDGFDAGFIDCRGTCIQYPANVGNRRPALTYVLVDENSSLPVANKSGTHDVLEGLELITTTELDGPILKLRIDARQSQLSTEGVPANQSHAVTSGLDTAELDSNEHSLSSRGKNINLSSNELQRNAPDILQLVLSNSTDWMVVKDLEHRFIAVSDLFLASQNKSADEIIGKNDLEIGTDRELVLGNPDKNWKGYWKLDDEVIASGKPSYSEHTIIHENALEQFSEHVAKVPVRNDHGDIIGLLVCVSDAEIIRNKGSRVPALSSRHDVEVAPIIRSLEDRRRKAEAQNKQTQSAFNRKNNFIATASHDLRQPLHAIGLFIESLEQQLTDPDQQLTLSKMKQSSRDLNEMLNSILDISKLDAEAVPVAKTHFSIAPLLKSLEDEFETEAYQKNLNLHVNSSNSMLHTDSLLLSRILRNLVSNAVKHTEGGDINVITEIQADTLLIRIKDSGQGIPKEQYQAIFEEYHQLAEQKNEPNFGMGLGLSIVKRLTDLLDIPIELESRLGQGTCFTLTVPLGEVSDDAMDQTLDTKLQSLEAYKVLILEDNPIVLDAMQEMLSGMNCDAYPSASIEEALEIIEEFDELPDLLLVDYQLGKGVTGDDAIKRICAAAKEAIPSIIVTGNTHSELFRKASKSAFRVLNKPVNPDVLLNSISSAIEEHRENRPLVESE